VRFGLSASSRFQPYQIRSAFPLSVSGSLLERGDRPAFAFRPFRLYQIRFPVRCRSEFRFPMIVGGVCLSAVPTLSEAFCRSEIGEHFPDKDSEVLRGIDVPTEADERLAVALEHV
ncbi:hypothetical protein, partial [Streptomyces chrestomyceticus]|uniref:hypothetical protein n=1 Tax=Streptomyces chrestomyceticus TaxID=68185 RepID=UPI00378A2615